MSRVGPSPLEVLRGTIARDTPLAPVHAALGVRLVAVEPGRCRGAMPAPPDPDGTDPVLPLLVLADFALGIAASSTLAAGQRITTLRLGLTVLRPVRPATALTAVGCLDDVVAGTAVSSGEIRDHDGTVLARAVARNAVLADAVAHAYGETPPSFTAQRSGAELLPDGAAVRPDPCTANSAGAVQGGVLAAVAARALGSALGASPDEVTATFLRAVAADGSAVRTATTLEHAGRSLRSGRTEVVDDRDRTVLTLSGLAYRPPP